MEEHHINAKVKEYIWTPDMDYQVFCRANNLTKEYDPNYKTFLKFEQQYIDSVLCQDSIVEQPDAV